MRHILILLGCVALIACDSTGSKHDQERELALAQQVSDQLTSEFGDSVAEASAPPPTLINAPQNALAVADSVEEGGVRQAIVATPSGVRRVAAVEACPVPSIDASDFRRMSIDPIPMTMMAPPNYQLYERRTRVVGRDTGTAIVESGIDRLWFGRLTTDSPYHEKGEWNVTSHCDDMVAGMHVHFDSAIKRGETYRRGISASFQLPSGTYIVVQGEFHDDQSVRQALYALRTVQLK
jgi:hypothetical protein